MTIYVADVANVASKGRNMGQTLDKWVKVCYSDSCKSVENRTYTNN